jgi:hypothetical protein
MYLYIYLNTPDMYLYIYLNTGFGGEAVELRRVHCVVEVMRKSGELKGGNSQTGPLLQVHRGVLGLRGGLLQDRRYQEGHREVALAVRALAYSGKIHCTYTSGRVVAKVLGPLYNLYIYS